VTDCGPNFGPHARLRPASGHRVDRVGWAPPDPTEPRPIGKRAMLGMGPRLMAAVRGGIPDWQNSFGAEEFTLLPDHDDKSLYYLLPRIVTLAERADRAPDFTLEFVSDNNTNDPRDLLYTNINMCLTTEGGMARAYQFLTKSKPKAGLMPATLTTEARWYFEIKGVRHSDLFAWDEVGRARIYRRISAELGNLIYGALANVSLSIARAAIGAEIAAFLPQIQSTVSFDPAALLKSLGDLNPGGASVPFRPVVEFFGHAHPGLLEFSGADSGGEGRSRALALAGHVSHFLGASAGCPRISDGPHIALHDASDPKLPKRMVWDLRTPLMAVIPLLFDFDPFTPIVKRGEGDKISGRDKVTKFTRVPPLPDEFLTQRVAVAANLPENILTHVAIELNLQVAAGLSRTGSPQNEVITLYPPGNVTANVALKFKKSTPKSYKAQLHAISADQVLDLPWFDCSGDYLYIGAESLPGTWVTIRASPQLLSQAGISAEITGDPKTRGVVASLSEAQPRATYLLPIVSETARLVVTARDPAHSANALTLDLPCRTVSLDLPAFPQYGPQGVTITVEFRPGVDAAEFDFQPEGDADGEITLRFTPGENSKRWNYLVTNLFRTRYRFRTAPREGAPEPAWSDYRLSEEPLTIEL
jgi:hypothetical protein